MFFVKTHPETVLIVVYKRSGISNLRVTNTKIIVRLHTRVLGKDTKKIKIRSRLSPKNAVTNVP